MSILIRVVILCLFSFFLPANVYALDAMRIEAGSGDGSIDAYKISLQKNFDKTWFESPAGKLSGFWEFGVSHWEAGKGSNKDLQAVDLSPVFVYEFNTSSNAVTPYVEYGLGLVYLSETTIEDVDLGMHFQFDHQLGAGVRLGARQHHDLSLILRHISNGGLDDKNDGMETLTAAYTYRF